MDVKNYVTAYLPKPMGIVFEENDADFGGVFVHSLKEDGVAALDGTVQIGDQLVAVHQTKVSGLPFDDALSAIIDANSAPEVKLIFFRGKADQFYGPTGASQEWLNEFVGPGLVLPAAVPLAKALEVVDVTSSSSTSSSSS
jgi:PDZ domain